MDPADRDMLIRVDENTQALRRALPVLEARVSILETARVQATAYIAGALASGTVIGGVVWYAIGLLWHR